MISLDVLPCSSCYWGFLWEWHGGNWAVLDRELPDTNILITTPFHPAYITKERLAKGKNLELLVTAGIGSDHIDLRAAAEKGLTVAEVTGDGPLAHVCWFVFTYIEELQRIRSLETDGACSASVGGACSGSVGRALPIYVHNVVHECFLLTLATWDSNLNAREETVCKHLAPQWKEESNTAQNQLSFNIYNQLAIKGGSMACSALIKMWIVCAWCNQIKGSNTSSVAEDEVLRVLVLVRNFLPGWRQTWEGKWDVAAIAHKAHDLSDKVVGTVGAGRIGQLLMQRLKVTTIYVISRNFGSEVTAKNCSVLLPTYLLQTYTGPMWRRQLLTWARWQEMNREQEEQWQ